MAACEPPTADAAIAEFTAVASVPLSTTPAVFTDTVTLLESEKPGPVKEKVVNPPVCSDPVFVTFARIWDTDARHFRHLIVGPFLDEVARQESAVSLVEVVPALSNPLCLLRVHRLLRRWHDVSLLELPHSEVNRWLTSPERAWNFAPENWSYYSRMPVRSDTLGRLARLWRVA